MKVTDIIERSDQLTKSILERMMLEDAQNCGCPRCLKIIEMLSHPTKKGKIK